MITKVRFYTTRILDTKEQTSTIRTLYLAVPADYPSFLPGHVIRVQPEKQPDKETLPSRPYCICSFPEDKRIEICLANVNKQGLSGNLYEAALRTNLEISPPQGEFLLHESLKRSLLLIGIGSGIGVAYGFMRQHYRWHPTASRAVRFYAINSDETSVPYRFELESASERHSSLDVYPILQTNGYDTDEISDRILSHTKIPSEWDTYLAGPTLPVRELRRNLTDLGFSSEHLYFKEY